MTTPTRFLALALALVSAVAAASSHSHAFADCIPNEAQLLGGAIVTSTDAVFELSNGEVGGEERIAYDLVRGTLDLEYCCSLATTSVETHDLYDLVGVPTGTVVPVIVTIDSMGEVYDAGGCGGSGCGGLFAASIQHGDAFREEVFAPTLFAGARAAFAFTIVLPTTIVAGTPAEIRFRLWGRRAPGGSHGAYGTSRIGFAIGNPRASLTSCYGYVGHEVPARPASWGELKASYR